MTAMSFYQVFITHLLSLLWTLFFLVDCLLRCGKQPDDISCFQMYGSRSLNLSGEPAQLAFQAYCLLILHLGLEAPELWPSQR